MTTTSISSALPRIMTEAPSLVKMPDGEYTAASVDSHPSLAAGLIKLKDGNYSAPIVAASDRYTGLNTDLSSLKLGG